MEKPNPLADFLLRIVEQGKYKRVEIRDFLALLVLSTPHGKDPRRLTPELQTILGEFSYRIGFVDGAKSKLQDLIDGYFLQNPPNPELMREFYGLLSKESGLKLEEVLERPVRLPKLIQG